MFSTVGRNTTGVTYADRILVAVSARMPMRHPPELKDIVRKAFAGVPRGHVIRGMILTELKRRKDMCHALTVHHKLPLESDVLSRKIVDTVRFLK